MLKDQIPNGKVVSADGPKEDEKCHEILLREWLTTTIEPEEETARRRSVLERINQLVRVWICQTMMNEFHMQEPAARQISARIFATGSYRYNVHTSGSDIDIVLIAPSRITRDHFFNSLAPRLKNEPWVKDLRCIRDARVPIIAMVCDGIDIDLSFGSIRQDCVPDVITDDLLLGLDEQSVLSCNAVRVAHNIMSLVPDSGTFRQTLRFVKAWGKRRGIYSNTFGFPSGIGWAILVAFVSQCYPNQNAAGLVTRFFRTYHTWFKPNPRELGTENRAIYLTPSMRAKTPLGRCWDPRESKSDAMALFPVLTPALPYGNACYNVTSTNLKQLCEEFKRGHKLTSQYLSLSPAEAQEKFGPYGLWSKILEGVKLFGEYPHYMHIQIQCHDPELYQGYVDAVESKIRILWAGNASSRGRTLEDLPQLKLRLHPRRFEDPTEELQRSQLLKKANNMPFTASGNNTNSRASGGGTSRFPGRDNVGGTGSLHLRTAGTESSLPLPIIPTSVDTGGASVSSSHPSLSCSAHYFIGISVDTQISTAPIDLIPSISVFHQAVRQLRQYKEGVTVLPKITVKDLKSIPDWVLRAEGYTPPTAEDKESTANCDGSAAAGRVAELGQREKKAADAAAESQNGVAPSEKSSVPEVGKKRERTDHEKSSAAPSVAANSNSSFAVSSSPLPKAGLKASKLSMEEIDLEAALGFDF